MRRNSLTSLCAAALLLAPYAALAAPAIDRALEQRYIEHVKFLASPELEGRGAGTKGLGRASDYIADHFKKLGLQPAGDKGTYKQDFPVTTGAKLGEGNRLSIESGPALRLGEDFRPISFSSNAKVSAPVVFAGYGITARELGYDDYAGLDVKNKLVAVLRYEPKRFSKFEPGKRPVYTHHSHLVNKAINARNHGASGVLLVNTESGKDELIEFGRIAGPDNAGIAMAQVKRTVVDEWLKPSGKTLAALESEPSSFALPGNFRVSLHVDVFHEKATVNNVLGYLPGRSKEYVVIGAHYDHIGYGHHSSMAPDQAGKIHPGADDNASGTAGLLELARFFAQRRSELDRGILFAAFSGEELGLLGSARWVDQPTLPMPNAVAMINLDMIGRVNGAKLFIGGTGSGSTFDSLVNSTIAKYGFKVETAFNSSSSSDHASFLAKDIPSLFFFSGVHGDYHRPGDTWEKIDTSASANVVNVVADVVSGLIKDAVRPQFVKAKPAPRRERAAGRAAKGPYLGITPEFLPSGKGVRVEEVAEGSPAHVAGIEAGDTLTAIDGNPIRNFYDLSYALGGRKAGEVLRVQIIHEGKPKSLQLTLAERP